MADKFSAAYEALKAKVTADPFDFTSWTGLLAESDVLARSNTSTGNVEDVYRIEVVRDAYSIFLSRFPFCYGYWKKYAEHELKNGSEKGALTKIMLEQQAALGGSTGQEVDVSAADAITANGVTAARLVYEKGVAAVPHAVELWVAYASFMSEHYTPAAARAFYAASGNNTVVDDVTAAGWATHDIRSVFTRATEVSALDPKAGQLWNSWVEWETKMANHKGVATVYAHMIATGAQYVETQWLKFKMYASFRPLHELYLDDADEEAVRKQARSLKGASDDPTLSENELRAAVLTIRENVAKASLAEASLRKPFENALGKRTYYHVKPLDNATLQAWRNYLNFEEEIVLNTPKETRTTETLKRVEKLYGRCLVACANYAEFWLRYAAWKLKLKGDEPVAATDEIFTLLGQAITTFVPRRLDVHLFYCTLLESSGQGEYANTYFASLITDSSWCKNSLELQVRYCNYLQRNGRAADALQHVSALLSSASSAQQKAALQLYYVKLWRKVNRPQSPSTPYITAKRGVYDAIIGLDPSSVSSSSSVSSPSSSSSSPLWLTYIADERNMLQEGLVADFTHLKSVYKRAAATNMAAEALAVLHLNWIDDADVFGTAADVLEACIAYRRWHSDYTGQQILHQAVTVDSAELVAASSSAAVLHTGLAVEAEEVVRDADSVAGRKRGAGEAGITHDDAGSSAKMARTDESPVVTQQEGASSSAAVGAYPPYYGAAQYSADAAYTASAAAQYPGATNTQYPGATNSQYPGATKTQYPGAASAQYPGAAYGAYGAYGYQQGAYPQQQNTNGYAGYGAPYRPYGF